MEIFREQLKEFVKERNWEEYHTPKNLAASICIEAAELMEIFQWENYTAEEVKNNSDLKSRVEEEFADVLIYLLYMANVLDINIPEALKRKIDMNKRKYPKGQR